MKCKYCNFENNIGDRYCENCGASLEGSSGAMDDVSAIAPVTSGDLSSSTQTPEGGQSNNYGQPTGYGQQGGGYGQPNNYGQPTGYGQQQYGYGQPNMYNGPIFGYQGPFNESDDSPKYVGFGEAIKLYFKNFFNFKGRSTRSEFWFGFLFNFIIGIVLGCVLVGVISASVSNVIKTSSQNTAFSSYNDLIGSTYTYTLIASLIGIVLAIPYWACGVRRLHDAGKSGLWMLLLIAGSIPTYLRLIPGIDASMINGLSCLFMPIALGGLIVNIIFWCQPSVGENQWGLPAKPKY